MKWYSFGMAKRYEQYCPMAHALDLVGDRWTLLVVRELMHGPKRYTDLVEHLHGIGTNMHMDPQIPNYAVRETGPKLVDGFTGAIEPMVTLGTADTTGLDDAWTVVTADGSRSCHWEHSVAVRDEGLWILTAIDGGESWLAAAGAPFAPLA